MLPERPWLYTDSRKTLMDTAMTTGHPQDSKADDLNGLKRPSKEEAEAAVRTLIEWAGDDPDREGLRGTPDRVARAYQEFFAGYN